MHTLNLTLPDAQYPIFIGENLLQAERLLPFLKQKKVAIITNTTVAPLYLAPLRNSLEAAGVAVLSVILPDGENYKTWESLNQIFDALIEARAERSTTLIALGGGVIGDMTGFAAACWQRGAPFIQIPTTLLAQVDSSVGGKTAINHPKGKNMIGAFYQPQCVLIDIQTLNTLPHRELSAGLAEVIKYGLLGDVNFFAWLEQNHSKLMARDADTLSQAILHCCQMKADIVGRDEKEQGERALLNLGHTFGHAIEAGLGFGAWLHGEAVAAGMVLAAESSRLLGQISELDLSRLLSLLKAVNLPTNAPNLGLANWLELMNHDKKVQNGVPRFVLLSRLGEAYLHQNLSPEILRSVLTGRFIAD